jgi:hypothetical protein
MDESACFSYELDELERSLAQATFQARAWATGDVAALKSSGVLPMLRAKGYSVLEPGAR